MNKRTCLKCDTTYPLDADHFYRHKRSGFNLWCKSCKRIASRKRYQVEIKGIAQAQRAAARARACACVEEFKREREG